MKKTLSAALAAILLLSMLLSGCNAQKKLLGTWEAHINMASAMHDALDLGEELEQYFTFDDFTVTMVLTLREDGTYTAALDQASMETAMDALLADMGVAAEQMLTDQLETTGAGMTAAELLSLMGTTMEELIAEMMIQVEKTLDEQNIVGAAVESSKTEGRFKLSGDKLYMTDGPDDELDSDTYEVCKLEGSSMTWSFHVGDETLDLGSIYPIEWKKTA